VHKLAVVVVAVAVVATWVVVAAEATWVVVAAEATWVAGSAEATWVAGSAEAASAALPEITSQAWATITLALDVVVSAVCTTTAWTAPITEPQPRHTTASTER
jgi:hypothetical protein